MRCSEAVDGVHEHCCLHDHGGDGYVCCWCGDLFAREDETSEHGEYRPDVAETVAERDAAQAEAAARRHAAVRQLRRVQLGTSTPAPAPKKTELKTPKASAAPSSGKHIEALKALRANFEEDGDPQNGFARATTGEIAKAMGVSPKEALTLLQKAAKEGLVARRGHTSQVGIGKKNRAGAVAEGFGYQIWDLKNSVKLP